MKEKLNLSDNKKMYHFNKGGEGGGRGTEMRSLFHGRGVWFGLLYVVSFFFSLLFILFIIFYYFFILNLMSLFYLHIFFFFFFFLHSALSGFRFYSTAGLVGYIYVIRIPGGTLCFFGGKVG